MQSTAAYAARGSSRLGPLDLASATEEEVGLSIAVQRLTEDGRFVCADDGARPHHDRHGGRADPGAELMVEVGR